MDKDTLHLINDKVKTNHEPIKTKLKKDISLADLLC